MSPSRDEPRRTEAHGWTLLAWREFARQYAALQAEVRRLRQADPEGYRGHPRAKLFALLVHLLFEVIPANPDAPQFRQGNTLGTAHRHWRRAKFARRFRLFFRFHSPSRVIVYTWLNDEDTLRKAGARTDPYVVFRQMLERGRPPSEMADLLEEADRLDEPD
ncbi:MAG TPA: type II toxin-antitoxin system YhaV family toxin [Longimicrobium sp.]